MPYLAGGQSANVELPRDHARLMATWEDIDGVYWVRRHIGVDFIIERVTD